ncbi:hypothetical protein SAMN05421858_2554 [Haladaptatus litoreus]|uniref:DUF8108 domain-containing protein n=1 Tax=Haladaptatus litoreus TaxID=553468 RepID=A0A1N7BGZ5_9EURY|nr:hypothetical protein [Haladaptatus litoreus]SIR50627.1 hypothetical protein SAMN05421858_2554 [Haladaptatus litoreus]
MTSAAANRPVKWTLALAGILLGAAFLGVVAKSLVSWKALLLLLAVFVPAFLLSYRLSKARRAYDTGRYGIGRRVVTEQTTLSDSCSVCDRSETRNQPGIRRRFVKELVVDGVPVALVADGQNDYCAECAETAPEIDSEMDTESQSQIGSEERERAE